jgi:hypothetical protein
LTIRFEQRLDGYGGIDHFQQSEGESDHAVVANVAAAPGEQGVLSDDAVRVDPRQYSVKSW